MDAQAIQQVLNGIAAVEKGLTKHQIANRIEAERRRGDPEFSKACSRAQLKQHENPSAARIASAKRKHKAVVTPFGKFESVTAFNEYMKEKSTKVLIMYNDKRLAMPHLYYVEEDGPGEPTYENVVYTPWGYAPRKTNKFVHCRDLLQKAKAANDPLATNKDFHDWIKKCMFRHPDQYYQTQEVSREWALEIL